MILAEERIEPPEEGLFLDDLGVVLDVQALGDAVHQRGEVGRAADLLERAVPSELLAQGEEIDRARPCRRGG